MKIKDALGIGKILPVDKLLDNIAKAIGRISKSKFDEIDIQTETKRIGELANAVDKANTDNPSLNISYEKEGLSINKKEEPLNRLIERANNRETYTKALEQLNTETVLKLAYEDLKNAPEIPDTPLDDDWRTRYFNEIKYISNEEMQKIWSKILVEEIKEPNSFSLRTLDAIKNLSSNDAKQINSIAEYVISSDEHLFIPSFIFDKDTILQAIIGDLIGINIINPLINSFLSFEDEKDKLLFHYQNRNLAYQDSPKKSSYRLHCVLFTKVGIEILSLIKPTFNEQFFEKLQYFFIKDGLNPK